MTKINVCINAKFYLVMQNILFSHAQFSPKKNFFSHAISFFSVMQNGFLSHVKKI
jgi:hypothetical protein